MNYSSMLACVLVLASFAFASPISIVSGPLEPRLLGCVVSSQNVTLQCFNAGAPCNGGGATVCNIETGVCFVGLSLGRFSAGAVATATLSVLQNGSARFYVNGGYEVGDTTTTNQLCPIELTSCRLNLTTLTTGSTVSFNFSGNRLGLCAAPFIEQRHFRNDTMSNFSLIPHNLGGLRWSCDWNASSDYSLANGSFSLVPPAETQTKTLVAGVDIANTTFQTGAATCRDELGNSLTVYRSGCGVGMACQVSGSPWTWTLGVPEQWRIADVDGVFDAVTTYPGIVYAHEELRAILFRVVSRYNGINHPAIRSFHYDFTLPAGCSMGSASGTLNFQKGDADQIYQIPLYAMGGAITCIAASNITLNLTASGAVTWSNGDEYAARSDSMSIHILVPAYTIDNVQAYLDEDGTVDYWADISHSYSRSRPVDGENISCNITAIENRMGGVALAGNATLVPGTFGTNLHFDLNASPSYNWSKVAWAIQCGGGGTAGTNGTECVNETITGNRTNYTNAHGQAVTTNVPSFTIPAGWWFIPAANMSLRAVTQYTQAADSCPNTCTTAHLYDAAHASLANATFADGVAEFDYPLASGKWYAIDCNSGGAAYSLCYAVSAAYPYVLDNVSVVARSENGGNDTVNIGAIKSITVSEQPYNVTGCVNGTNGTNGTSGGISGLANGTKTYLARTLVTWFGCMPTLDTNTQGAVPWILRYSSDAPERTLARSFACTIETEDWEGEWTAFTCPEIEDEYDYLVAGLGMARGWGCAPDSPNLCSAENFCASEVSGGTEVWRASKTASLIANGAVSRFSEFNGSSVNAFTFSKFNNVNSSQPAYDLFSRATLDVMFRMVGGATVYPLSFRIAAKANASVANDSIVEVGDSVICSFEADGVHAAGAQAVIEVFANLEGQKVLCDDPSEPLFTASEVNTSDGVSTTFSRTIRGVGVNAYCNSLKMGRVLINSTDQFLYCSARLVYVSASGAPNTFQLVTVALPVRASSQYEDPDESSNLPGRGLNVVFGIADWLFNNPANFLAVLGVLALLVILMPIFISLIKR